MRRCAITVCGLAVLIGMSSPARAVPILDIQGLGNLELDGSHYGRELIVSGGGRQSDLPFEPGALSIVGTTGSSQFSGDLHQEQTVTFDESSLFETTGLEQGSAFSDTTSLSGNRLACGQPGWWFNCFEVMAVPAASAAVSDLAQAVESEQAASPDNAGQPTPRVEARYRSAVAPIVFVLFTGGLAAAGFAGWRTFLKGRRFTKTRRRDASRRRRSGSAQFS